MDVFNFAKGMIALVVLISIGIVIWSMYQVGKLMEETRHAPAVVALTTQAPIATPAARCCARRCSCGYVSPYRGG
jgi:hypothetical protein